MGENDLPFFIRGVGKSQIIGGLARLLRVSRINHASFTLQTLSGMFPLPGTLPSTWLTPTDPLSHSLDVSSSREPSLVFLGSSSPDMCSCFSLGSSPLEL